jgi:glutamyl-tRNA synthetase
MAAPWFDRVLAGKGMDYRRLAELMQSRTDIFSRIPEKIAFLAEMPDYDPAIFFNKKQKSDEAVAKEVLPLLVPVLEGISGWTEQNIHDAVMEKIQEWGRKNGTVLWPMRIAISGQESTPGGAFEIAYLLGREETLRRLQRSIAKLG